MWSLAHTSLAHSLLFVSSTPVLMACGGAALGYPVSRGEGLGTLLGVLGSLLLAVDPSVRAQGGDVTLAGDAASLLASLAFIGYITAGALRPFVRDACLGDRGVKHSQMPSSICTAPNSHARALTLADRGVCWDAGRHLRSWLPVFVYVVPVTFCAAVLMAGFALLAEGASLAQPFSSAQPPGVVAWLQPRYLPRVLYLGVRQALASSLFRLPPRTLISQHQLLHRTVSDNITYW